MTPIVGVADRFVRIVLGLVPLLTALAGYCPAYALCGTAARRKAKA